MAIIDDIKADYELIKGYKLEKLISVEFSEALQRIVLSSQSYLNDCDRVPLVSRRIKDKDYFVFKKGNNISRAVRKDLFIDDTVALKLFLVALEANDFKGISTTEKDKACYTIAIGACAVFDVESGGNNKVSGAIFFERFVGYCFSKRLGVTPANQVDVINIEGKTSLPTDFIFDLGFKKPKFHVPVKTSTRERIIQVWAHQRVLDGVSGAGRFLGTLTCLSETNVYKKDYSVVETCLPQQWQVYQMFIAQMKRVYYLDPPSAYTCLNDDFPKIHVKSFSAFLEESELLSLIE